MNQNHTLSLLQLSSILVAGAGWVGCPTPSGGDASPDAEDVQRLRDSAPQDVAPDIAIDAVDDLQADAPVDTVVPDAGPGTVHVRFGNVLSPIPGVGLPPTIDVCIRPSSGSTTTFIGPVLEMNGLTAGVAWNQVSRYFDVVPGHYDLLLVSATATDCNTPIAPPMPAIDFGANGGFRGVVAYGILMGADASVPTIAARVGSFGEHDPATAATALQPLLHVFDALPSAARFDVGIVGDPTMPAATFLPIWGNVGFGEVGTAAAGMAASFDALNYFAGSALPSVDVGARPVGSTGAPTLTLHGLAIADHSYTLSVLTLVMPTPPGTPVPGVMLCADSAPPAGNLSRCLTVAGM